MTHTPEVVQRVFELHAAGLGGSDIAAATGVHKSSVSRWLSSGEALLQRRVMPRSACFLCDSTATPPAAHYAYLLGLYRGDGQLVRHPREVWALRIYQDARYPNLIQRCADVVWEVARRRAGHQPLDGCVKIYAYWKHWIHLFPQHGAGRKHERSIVLEPW